MSNLYKYPRTLHLPWSRGVQSDDKVLRNVHSFLGKYIVVTEKMDGENTTLYPDYIHARSVSSVHHSSQDWVKSFWRTFSYKIPDNKRICGENLYAKHSVFYPDLDSYFYCFSIWNGANCLSWVETKRLADSLGIKLVPVLYEGIYDEALLKQLASDLDLEKTEGYVIRLADAFDYSDFQDSVAKFVRKDHVQTNKHWKQQQIIPNGLRKQS